MDDQVVSVVTGGAGFIGSHICEQLLRQGQRVRVLDNFSTGKRGNLAALVEKWPDRLEVVEADIRDWASLRAIVERARFVFHQAAIVSVQKSVEDPLESNAVNLSGTLKVLQAAREAGVKKVVLASSTAIYGESEELPKREDMRPDPMSPYAAGKYAGEVYGRVFATLYGLPVVALRYFNVFGPRQDPNSEYAAVVPKFVDRMLSGKPPTVYGDGEQTRDFVFVGDVARANLLAANSAARGVCLNIASGERYSLNSLVLILNQLLGVDYRTLYEPARVGEVRHSLGDISLARTTLGYSPQVSFREGLKRTIEWFRASQGNQGN